MALPAGWVVKSLGDVADTALGKMLDRGKPRGLAQVPYLRNVNVQWGRIDTSDLLTMELADDELDRFAVKPGDLLVCEGGEIGRAAIWKGRAEYIAYQKALHRIRPNDSLDPTYLRYLLEYYAGNGTLAAHATGSTIAHISQQKLRRLPVPVAPIEQQRRIVDILEDHLSRLDAADHYLDVAARRTLALERGALGRCRDGEIAALSEVAAFQGGIQKQPKRTPRDNAYPFLRVANVTAVGLDLTEVHMVELFGVELDRFRLRAGDLLVVEGNGSPSQIGRAALWDGSIEDCVHQNHLIRVRPDEKLLPEYLEAVWNSPQNRAFLTQVSSSSSGLHTLSVAKLKPVPIPVPSLGRQRELVSHVVSARGARVRLGATLTESNRRSHSMRQALAMAAFQGRLTGQASDSDRVEELANA